MLLRFTDWLEKSFEKVSSNKSGIAAPKLLNCWGAVDSLVNEIANVGYDYLHLLMNTKRLFATI